MPTIGQLNQMSSLQPSDILPLFVGMSQATRRATIAQLMEYIQENIVIPEVQMFSQYAGPITNNFDVAIKSAGIDVHLILTPTGAFPTGNLTLPPVDECVDGQVILVNTTNTITSLTFTLNGAQAVIGVPGYLAQFGSFAMAFDLPSAIWYCISTSQVAPVTTDTAQTLSNKTFVNAALGTPVSGVLTNTTGFRVQNLANSTANILTFLQVPTAANLLAAVGGVTGTGNLVFANAPNLTAPNLGTPSAVNLANALNLPVQSLINITAALAAFFLLPSADNLRAAVGGVTGSGNLVFGNSPTLVDPALGTPVVLDLANAINMPVAQLAGVTNAMRTWLAGGTSAQLRAAITDETGSGLAVFNAGPTITGLSRAAPATKTAAFAVSTIETWLICNGAAAMSVTLPPANTNSGREIMFKNIAAFAVTSSTADVVPLAGGAPGTALLPATPGARATLVSDGTNWIIMA